MMDFFRNRSLRTQLVVLILLATVMGLLPVATVLSRRMDEASRRWFERRAVGMTAVMAQAVAPGVDFGDAAGLGEFMRNLSRMPEVIYAVVRRDNGALLAGWQPGRAPELKTFPGADPVVTLLDSQLRVDAAVHAKGGGTGIISIGFSLEEMEAEGRRNRLVVIAICAMVAVFGMLLFFLTGTFLARTLRRMSSIARRIAEGDLSDYQELPVGRDEIGELAATFNRMVKGQRAMVQQIIDTSAQLAAAATQLYASVQDQEAATAKQSAGVEEVIRTMHSLLDSAAYIADSARGVLANAERSKETADSTSGRISELSRHTSRIAEILEVIRDIADRSDLLALNASLEATRAGEAGRSFSLVAGEMRRLAERVTASVQDVKSLVADVRSSGSSTVLATEEARKLTDSTTESARQITVVTQQQRTGTEQVSESMRHISTLLSQSVQATQQTRSSAAILKTEAERLRQLVGHYHLDAVRGTP